MLKHWLEKQVNQPIYWLVDHQGYQQAIQHVAPDTLGEGIPIFTANPLESLIDVSPWLISINDSIIDLPNDMLSRGMLLTSHADLLAIHRHLCSLLMAAMEGDIVLFRFFDPVVLAPMLDNMDEGEINQFLGNIEHIAIPTGDGLVEKNNASSLLYIHKPAPWWRIEPRHVASQYNPNQHAIAVERRLWQMMPSIMITLNHPTTALNQGFNAAQQQGISPDDAELWVLGHLANQYNIDIGMLTQALHLDNDEQAQLYYWKENPQWQV